MSMQPVNFNFNTVYRLPQKTTTFGNENSAPALYKYQSQEPETDMYIPRQVPEEESSSHAGLAVGGTLLALAGVVFGARKGIFGAKLQKLLGGAENAAKDVVNHPTKPKSANTDAAPKKQTVVFDKVQAQPQKDPITPVSPKKQTVVFDKVQAQPQKDPITPVSQQDVAIQQEPVAEKKVIRKPKEERFNPQKQIEKERIEIVTEQDIQQYQASLGQEMTKAEKTALNKHQKQVQEKMHESQEIGNNISAKAAEKIKDAVNDFTKMNDGQYFDEAGNLFKLKDGKIAEIKNLDGRVVTDEVKIAKFMDKNKVTPEKLNNLNTITDKSKPQTVAKTETKTVEQTAPKEATAVEKSKPVTVSNIIKKTDKAGNVYEMKGEDVVSIVVKKGQIKIQDKFKIQKFMKDNNIDTKALEKTPSNV